MKVISMWQPWATLLVIGAKKFETRSWATKHRGDLLIHASKKWDHLNRDLMNQEPFASYLKGYNLPRGGIIGKVTLIDCHLISPSPKLLDLTAKLPDIKHEVAFGDWTQGRYAWQVADPQAYSLMIPEPGQQGMWNFAIEKYMRDGQA